jgi:hypothetical protein
MKLKYYLLVIWLGVDPELFGPYNSYQGMVRKARKFVRNEDLDRQHSIFWLVGDRYGEPEAHSFSGSQIDKWLESVC